MILGGIVILVVVLLLTGLMYDFKQSNENRLFTMSLSGDGSEVIRLVLH